MLDIDSMEIRPVQTSEEGVALELMQQDLTEEERNVRFDRDTVKRTSKWVAVHDEKVLGAIYWHPEPNQTALVWMPRCVPGLESEEVEAVSLALLNAVTEQAVQAGLDLVQAALGEHQFLQDQVILEEAEYEYLADLIYLACTPEAMPGEQPDSQLEFEPYEETEYERLTRLVEATYEETFDCPALNGVQAIDTVLEGYRNVGRFLPQHWRFIRHAGQDVGCLLLAEYPDQSLFELVYMGLIPEARGKGWGHDIARFAQWITRSANGLHLVVAVDAANTPAIRGYEKAGYTSWDRRVVYVKILKDK
jgi:ribosomal protein S18 acetylase RimI-like enzyme